MTDSIYGRFRCIHCGCKFNLSDEEQDTFDQGFYEMDPNCCDECYFNSSFADECFDFSDADPGL